MKITVIIPTYNESGSLAGLLDELEGALGKMRQHDWNILVVDGHSSDGTVAIVKQKMARNKNIHLIEEQEKGGIAAAYMTGIRYATDELHADAFMEFDGDGQHNPHEIERFVRKFDEGYDYIIGSRYIEGGGVPLHWGWHRKFLSKFGSLYTRILLEWPVKDATSGFKMTRVKSFAPPKKLLSRHYAYKMHLLSSMLESGARVTEVPIVFRPREHDTSKSTWRDVIESLMVTGILRLQTLRRWRLLRVLAVGGVGAIVQTVLFEWLGIWSHIVAPSTATLIGAIIAIMSNFLLNERFSFRDSVDHSTPLYKRISKFYFVSSGSLITQWSFIFIAEQFTRSALTLNIVYIVSVGIGFLINYTGYYFFVWRKD